MLPTSRCPVSGRSHWGKSRKKAGDPLEGIRGPFGIVAAMGKTVENSFRPPGSPAAAVWGQLSPGTAGRLGPGLKSHRKSLKTLVPFLLGDLSVGNARQMEPTSKLTAKTANAGALWHQMHYRSARVLSCCHLFWFSIVVGKNLGKVTRERARVVFR